MDETRLNEIKASGKPVEDLLDDLILEEKAKPHPSPLNVMWLLMVAYDMRLREAKLLTGIRCGELDSGMPKNPERIRALLASLGP